MAPRGSDDGCYGSFYNLEPEDNMEGSGGRQTRQEDGHKENSDEASVVELSVRLCCEQCEENLMDRLINLSGVQGVLCDRNQQKVTVSGTASSEDILKAFGEFFE